MLTKFSCLASALARRSLLQSYSACGYRTSGILKKNAPGASNKDKKDDKGEIDELDKPIKFSTSKAATWDPVMSRTGDEDPDGTPWYQEYVVSGSVAVFMIYFCILREENDIDEIMYRDLSEHFEGEAKEAIKRSQLPYLEYRQKMQDTKQREGDSRIPNF